MTYSSDFFDHFVHQYDEKTFPFLERPQILKRMMQEIEKRKPSSILDLGCGEGELLNLLKQKDPLTKMVGVDFSSKALFKAQEKNPQIKWIQASFQDSLPFHHSFDIILSTYAFHHFKDEEKAHIIDSLLQNHLQKEGLLMIGDASFQTHQEYEEIKNLHVREWDEKEFYFIYEDFQKILMKKKISSTFETFEKGGGLLFIEK